MKNLSKCLSGATTIFGEVEVGNGAINAQSALGGSQWFTTDDLKYNLVTDSSGDMYVQPTTSSLNKLVNSLGSTLNTVLDTVNKVGTTYQNITGSTLVSQGSSSQPKIDNDTITQIMNNAINQVKRYGVYVGIGVGAIILITLISNKRRKA